LSLLFSGGKTLEAVLNVSPNTISSISTFEMMISFDESMGKGGLITVILPDSSTTISEDFSESSLNEDLQFNDASSLTCFSDSLSLQSCSTPSSNQLDIQVGPDDFILAGDFISFTIEQGTTNPSSLWFLQ
jgi:hypothetical protein